MTSAGRGIGALAILDGTSLLDREGRVRSASSAVTWSRGCTWCRASGSGCTGRGWGWAGRCGWTRHPSIWPTMSESSRLPLPATVAQLLRACEQLAQRRWLDPARPLWQLWLLPGLPARRLGALFKMHHAMADGMAGVAAFGALLDLAPDAPTPVAPAWTPTPVPTSGELLRSAPTRPTARPCAGGCRPSQQDTARGATPLPAWREFLAEQRAPRTSLNRPISTERQLAIVRSRLESAADRPHLNDVVLTAVAGGLRQLLASRGEDVQERRYARWSSRYTMSSRGPWQPDGWMIQPLPLGESDPVHRLQLIAAETAQRKHEARPRTGSGVFGSLLLQRAFLHGFAHQRLMNTSVTNVPGPPVPLYLPGHSCWSWSPWCR